MATATKTTKKAAVKKATPKKAASKNGKASNGATAKTGNGRTSRRSDAGIPAQSRPSTVSPMLSKDAALKKLVDIRPLTGDLSLPELTEQWLKFSLRGTQALFNRFSSIQLDEIEAKQMGVDFVKPPRDPSRDGMEAAHIIEGRRHIDAIDTNVYAISAIALKKAMARAIFKAKLHDNMIDTCLYVHVDGPYDGLIPIKAPSPRIVRHNVKIGQGSNPKTSLAYRPEFASWEADVYVSYYPLLVNIGSVMMAMKLAGSLVGIGSFRKECWGDYGLFSVKEIKAEEHEQGWHPPHFTVTEDRETGEITNSPVEVDPATKRSRRASK